VWWQCIERPRNQCRDNRRVRAIRQQTNTSSGRPERSGELPTSLRENRNDLSLLEQGDSLTQRADVPFAAAQGYHMHQPHE
jgi:hypothetical protein